MVNRNSISESAPVATIAAEIDPALKEEFEACRKAKGFSTTSEALRHLIRVEVADSKRPNC